MRSAQDYSYKLSAQWVRLLHYMQEVHSWNPHVIIWICNPQRFVTKNYYSYNLSSKLKFLSLILIDDVVCKLYYKMVMQSNLLIHSDDSISMEIQACKCISGWWFSAYIELLEKSNSNLLTTWNKNHFTYPLSVTKRTQGSWSLKATAFLWSRKYELIKLVF